MATSFRKFLEGLRIIPKTASTASEKGDLDVTDSSGKLNYHNGSTASPVVTEDHQATLTNKTLTSPVLNTPTADTITGIAGGALTIQSASNEDLSLQAQGSGSVSLEALTVDGNTVTGGASTLTVQSDTDENIIVQSQGTGTVTIQAAGTGTVAIDDVTGITGASGSALTIQSASNQILSLQAQGTGTVSLESLTIDGNSVTGGASSLTIQSASNQGLTLQTQGSGNLAIQSTGTGNVTLDDVTTITGKASSALTIQSDTNQNISLSAPGSGIISATSPAVIAANSSSNALRITQIGSGNALLVEDSANPDSSPFVIDTAGKVAIGATTANTNLDLVGTFATRATDNIQTGTYVTVSPVSSTFVRLNGAITNLSGIAVGSDGQKITLSNKSGSAIAVLNSSGPAASDQYIVTGTGSDIQFESDASIDLIYNNVTAKWHIVGSVAGNLKVDTVSGSSTLSNANNVILANATSAAIDLALPVSAVGKTFTVKKIDSTANLVSLVPSSGTIDGTTRKSITGQYDSVQVVTDGTNWFII